jgi:hypothetical protein
MSDSPPPAPSSALPEPGQLVSVRNLRCVVADVTAGTLPAGQLAAELNHPQHLVTLSSIEDDAHGALLDTD